MSTSSNWQRIDLRTCTPKAPPKLTCNAEEQRGTRVEPGPGHHCSAWVCLTLSGRGTSCSGSCWICSLAWGCLAQWLGCAAGELLLKTQPAREVVWACGGISLLCSGGMWVMLSCHWLSLWDGNFGSGNDGEVRDSSRLGREKEGAPGLC